MITIIVLGVFLAQGENSAKPQDETLPPTVLIISLDGFRWDYLDTYKDNCSNILKFASQGVRAKSMQPVFPSKTFPVITNPHLISSYCRITTLLLLVYTPNPTVLSATHFTIQSLMPHSPLTIQFLFNLVGGVANLYGLPHNYK